MRDSILRVLDDLETRREEAQHHVLMQDSGYWHGFWTGIEAEAGYAIQELQKVLDENPKV